MFNIKAITGEPFSSFNPYFRVSNFDDARLLPLMQEVIDAASCLNNSWSNCGWYRHNDLLAWRSTFDDDTAMSESFARLAPIFDRLISGPASLDKFEFELPSSRLAKFMDATDIRGYDASVFRYASSSSSSSSSSFVLRYSLFTLLYFKKI
jgi:hypothetical protein